MLIGLWRKYCVRKLSVNSAIIKNHRLGKDIRAVIRKQKKCSGWTRFVIPHVPWWEYYVNRASRLHFLDWHDNLKVAATWVAEWWQQSRCTKCMGVILLRIANGPGVHLLKCPGGTKCRGGGRSRLLWHTGSSQEEEHNTHTFESQPNSFRPLSLSSSQSQI